MKAFWIKTNHVPPLFLGNDEAIFVFMARDLAKKYLDTTDAEPQEVMAIVEITIEEVQ